MKSVNGMILMVIGVFLLWIGVTGRLPKLIEAIGLVRGSDPTNKKTSNVMASQKSGSAPATSNEFGLTQKGQNWVDDTKANLGVPVNELWSNTLKGINASRGANVEW